MQTSYIHILKRKFEERLAINPRYSLRAYARSLRLDPGFLSHLLNQKRKLSVARAIEIAPSLKLSSSEKSVFINLVRLEAARTEDLKNNILKDLSKNLLINKIKELDLQVFSAISNWYHHAILELTFKDDFVLNPKSVSKTLGIAEVEAKMAIERLINLKLIKLDNKKYIKADGHLNPTAQVISGAQRQRHKQILTKASEALDSQSIDQREFQSITMCIDPALIPEAKKRIQEFAWDLCNHLESKKRKEIYEMSIQLFSLENRKES